MCQHLQLLQFSNNLPPQLSPIPQLFRESFFFFFSFLSLISEDFWLHFFSKSKPEIRNYDVWGYSRVSSKDQLLNNSLEYQKDAIKKCASDLNFNLTEMFGSTYESASDDLTRKEFMKLINAVEKAKKKPYGILIFKML